MTGGLSENREPDQSVQCDPVPSTSSPIPNSKNGEPLPPIQFSILGWGTEPFGNPSPLTTTSNDFLQLRHSDSYHHTKATHEHHQKLCSYDIVGTLLSSDVKRTSGELGIGNDSNGRHKVAMVCSSVVGEEEERKKWDEEKIKIKNF